MEAPSSSTVTKIKAKPQRDVRRARKTGTPEQLQQYLDKINQQAEVVRSKKTEQGEGDKWRKEAVMREIFNLMEIKYDYCCASPVPVTKVEHFVETEPAHSIKVRWKVRKPDGTIKRLQRPFYDVTSVTGKQVIDAVTSISHKSNKFPNLNGFIKIEHIVTNALGTEDDPTKRLYRTVLPEDKFCLPLKFPGPILQSEWHLQLRVTWPEQKNSLITPPTFTEGNKLPEIIDCGVNLFDDTFTRHGSDATAVVNRAIGAGVTQMICISVNPQTSQFSIDLSQTRQGTLFATVGVHPDDAQYIPFDEISKIKELAKDVSVVAIGECGIDMKRASKGKRSESVSAGPSSSTTTSSSTSATSTTTTTTTTTSSTSAAATSEPAKEPAPVAETTPTTTVAPPVIEETDKEREERIENNLKKQEVWLTQQIELAIELNKPLFFHVRGEHLRFMNIVNKFKDKIKGKALINCFTGTESELKDYLHCGFYIGITGFLCNKRRGEELQKLLKKIPVESIVIGSDAPYLTPFTMEKPYPKFNEPAFLQHTLVLAAECLGMSVHKLAEHSSKNTRKLFGLPVLPYDGFIRKFTSYSPNGKKAIAKIIDKPIVVVAPAVVGGEVKKEDGKPSETEVKGDAGKVAEPVKEDENVFSHKGKKYTCTPKEKAILEKQKKLLDDKSFEELFADFALKEQ